LNELTILNKANADRVLTAESLFWNACSTGYSLRFS